MAKLGMDRAVGNVRPNLRMERDLANFGFRISYLWFKFSRPAKKNTNR